MPSLTTKFTYEIPNIDDIRSGWTFSLSEDLGLILRPPQGCRKHRIDFLVFLSTVSKRHTLKRYRSRSMSLKFNKESTSLCTHLNAATDVLSDTARAALGERALRRFASSTRNNKRSHAARAGMYAMLRLALRCCASAIHECLGAHCGITQVDLGSVATFDLHCLHNVYREATESVGQTQHSCMWQF